jgi:hypothetical protein
LFGGFGALRIQRVLTDAHAGLFDRLGPRLTGADAAPRRRAA